MQLTPGRADCSERISTGTTIAFSVLVQSEHLIDYFTATGRQDFDLLVIENIANDDETIPAK